MEFQNNLTPYRVLPSEYRLHNELVELMQELSIPVAMVAVDTAENDDACRG